MTCLGRSVSLLQGYLGIDRWVDCVGLWGGASVIKLEGHPLAMARIIKPQIGGSVILWCYDARALELLFGRFDGPLLGHAVDGRNSAPGMR